jgi:DNA polymerase elongation subunit (family B)
MGRKRSIRGAIVLNEENDKYSVINDSCIEIRIGNSEDEIFHELVQLVRKWDPDILVGYDVQKWSWGYIFDRADSIKVRIYYSHA